MFSFIMSCNRLLCFVVFFSFFLSGRMQRISKKIYLPLPDNVQCFRLLNGTHQIGCQSARAGDIGMVVELGSDGVDLDWVLKDPHGRAPFIVAMDLHTWAKDRKTLMALKSSSHVSGLFVLLRNGSDLDQVQFSPDHSCPNYLSSLYQDSQSCSKDWNPAGDGRWFLDWDKPIFMLENETEVAIVKECARKLSRGDASYPLCGARLKLWMLAAQSTETCLRRSKLFDGLNTGRQNKFCSPLSDYSLYAFIPPSNVSANQTLSPESVFVLSARMDSFGMFATTSPGMESSLASVIVLLSIAEALGRNTDQFQLLKKAGIRNNKSLLLLLLNGESFDYIGSSRLLWDMEAKRFPVDSDKEDDTFKPDVFSVDKIGFFLEVGQVGLSEGTSFYAHVDGTAFTKNKTQIEKVYKNLERKTIRLNWAGGRPSASSQLPPASYQTFLKKSPQIPGLLVGDFDQRFKTKVYNSFLDRKFQFSPDAPKNLEAISQALLEQSVSWVLGPGDHNFTISNKTVEELFDCFMGDWYNGCQLFRRLKLEKPNMPTQEYFWERTYVSPNRRSVIRGLTNGLLCWYLGTKSNTTKEQCAAKNFTGKKDEILSYKYMLGLDEETEKMNVCVVSSVQKWKAESPAFKIDDYKWDSMEFPSWTESVWQLASLQLFERGDPGWEGGVLALGLLIFAVSLLVVYVVSSRAHLLFPPSPVDV